MQALWSFKELGPADDVLQVTDQLFGAYGMFWDRDAVTWKPGSGSQPWQLLGHNASRRPALRVCDFRKAQGFYILFDDHGAQYVGLARGRHGLGARLQSHHDDKQAWSRFCWFAFDDVEDTALAGWSQVRPRTSVKHASADLVLRECEALLIEVLGTGRVLKSTSTGRDVRIQNSMRFAGASRWTQIRDTDFQQPRGRAHKVDKDGFTDPWLGELAQLDRRV